MITKEKLQKALLLIEFDHLVATCVDHGVSVSVANLIALDYFAMNDINDESDCESD